MNNKCVGCNKKIKNGEFVVLGGGALLKTSKNSASMDSRLLGFLSVSNHFDSKEDYKSFDIAGRRSHQGQFEFYACSHDCLVDFMRKSIKKNDKSIEEKNVDCVWKDVDKELPTRKTPYANKMCAYVLGFDLEEYIDSGSCTPFEVSYFFKEKQFKVICTNGTWTPYNVTHWLALPQIPVNKGINH